MKGIRDLMRPGGPFRTPQREKGSFRGFTLLELVISLMLVAAILLIIGGALRLGYRSVQKGEKKMESLERFRASFTIVKAQIESVIPVGVDHGGIKEFYFRGRADGMRLATTYSIWGGQRGHVMVEYAVEISGAGTHGLKARESILGAVSQRETMLFVGLDRICFEYYGRKNDEGHDVWMTEWTDNTRMPQRIRIWLIQGRREISMTIPMRAQPA